MIVNALNELTIISILDRGVPNQECIAIKVNEKINLGQYGIMLGMYSHSKLAMPFQDNLFWFGDGYVDKGDWIFVYTGDGEPKSSHTKDELKNIYSLFWAKQNTVFANSNIVPLLFKVDAVDVFAPQENVPQISR